MLLFCFIVILELICQSVYLSPTISGSSFEIFRFFHDYMVFTHWNCIFFKDGIIDTQVSQLFIADPAFIKHSARDPLHPKKTETVFGLTLA